MKIKVKINQQNRKEIEKYDTKIPFSLDFFKKGGAGFKMERLRMKKRGKEYCIYIF